MIKNITSRLINRFLRKYIVFDEEKSLHVQSWHGNVNLKDIKLVQQNICTFSVNGSIEDFYINIPWKNFISGFVTISASNISIVVEDHRETVIHKDQKTDIVDEEKTNMSFIMKKILEKMRVSVENITLVYKIYSLHIGSLTINDQREIIFENISLDMDANGATIRKIIPFNIKGKIAENHVNVYVDCIDVILKRRDITMIALDVLKIILDLRQFIGKKINISNLLPEGTVDSKSNISQNKDVRPIESARKLIDAEKNISLHLVIDVIRLRIIKETKSGFKEILKYRLVDWSCSYTNTIDLKLQVRSRTARLNVALKNNIVAVTAVDISVSKIVKRLGYKMKYGKNIKFICDEILVEDNKLTSTNVCVRNKKMKMCISQLTFYSTKMVNLLKIDDVNVTTDILKLFLYSKVCSEILLNNKIARKLCAKRNEDEACSVFCFYVQSFNMNDNLLINNLSVMPDCNVNELENVLLLGGQPIINNPNALTVNIGNVQYLHHKLEHYCINIPDINHFNIPSFCFGSIKIDDISKVNDSIYIKHIEYKNNVAIGFAITLSREIKVQVKKLIVYYAFELVETIYRAKDILYACITDHLKPENSNKRAITIDAGDIVYEHKCVFNVKRLLFKNDKLIVYVYTGDVKVTIDLEISDSSIHTNVDVNGIIDTVQYNNVLYSVVYFIEALINIFENKYEKINETKDVQINTHACIVIDGVTCNRMGHCTNAKYLIQSDAYTIVDGKHITTKLKKGSLKRCTAVHIDNGEILTDVNNEEYIDVEGVDVDVKIIPFGFNINVSIVNIVSSVLLHRVVIMKEYYLLPQLGIIGTALKINCVINIRNIECVMTYDEILQITITEFYLRNDRMAFSINYDNVTAKIHCKTTYDIVNTIKITSSNVIAAKDINAFKRYRKIIYIITDEFTTGFTSGRNNQINLIIKNSELYVNRNIPSNQDKDRTLEAMPLFLFKIEKLMFFLPTTGSIKFVGRIFNPKTLEYDLLFEPVSIVVSFLGDKIDVKCSALRISIEKETFKTFSFDHQEYVLRVENIMKDIEMFFLANNCKQYDLCASNSSIFSDGTTSTGIDDQRTNGQKIVQYDEQKVNERCITPLTGAIIHKRFYSKAFDIKINSKNVTVDLTNEQIVYNDYFFIFTKIHNINRHLIVFNHIYFKNCLPYELKIYLGNDDVQDEIILLKNELSFNTTHMFLRIGVDRKVSADSFMFQKGVLKADNDNVFLFLDNKSIHIDNIIVNVLLYVQNCHGNLIYYVFFVPNCYVVNKTHRSLNVHLDGNLFFKNVTIDSDEIVAADCWKFKNKIFISDHNVKLTTSEMHNSTEQHDLVISHRAPAEYTPLLLTCRKLSLNIMNGMFKIIRLYVIHPHFIVNNSINEKVYVDDQLIKKEIMEISIARGSVLINSKLRTFNFNVLNILKEIDHRYLFSMETKHVEIDMGRKLNIVDQDNVADYNALFFEQKVLEIKYGYIIVNNTDTELSVNNVFIACNEQKPIEMQKNNVLIINSKAVNLLICPYFRIGNNFYTIITKLHEKQKIMKIIASEPPIEIINNTQTTVCVDKAYFLSPNERLNYVNENYKDQRIVFDANIGNRIVRVKRKYGQSVCIENFKVTSIDRGAKEYIYLGTVPTNTCFRDVFSISIESLMVSLFENSTEFINAYFRHIEVLKQVDADKNLFTYAFSVRGMQIDNQEYKSSFPIIMHPINPLFYYRNTTSTNAGYFMLYKCEVGNSSFDHEDDHALVFNYAIFAIHEFELSIEEDVLTRLFDWLPSSKEKKTIFFTLLHIHPINLRLNLLMSKKKHLIQKFIGFIISNISEVRISLTSLIFSQFEYNNEIIMNAYKMQMLSQILNLIGGLDFLGNISSLVEELSLGVHDLFYEPYIGFKHDDLFMFTKGIVKGGRNFVTYFISGLTNTVSKVGRSISRSPSNRKFLFYDELEIDVSKDLLENVVDGLSGIITKPVKGAKKGIKGFVKGVGSGLKGALTKPIAGISEFAANISENIKTCMHGVELRRVQYPRCRLEPYNLEFCQAFFLFNLYKNKEIPPIDTHYHWNKKVVDEKFIGGGIGKIYDVKVHIVITDQRVLMFSKQSNLYINIFLVIYGGIKVKDWIIELNSDIIDSLGKMK